MWTFIVAVAATTVLFTGVQWQASRSAITATLTFSEGAFTTSRDVETRLGGPLTPGEIADVKRISRGEVERAFAGLRVRLTDGRAFWRVRVVPTIVTRTFNGRAIRSPAGTSFGFGPLGGGAFLNFNMLAFNALRHAPPDASRQDVVEGIARGIGRAAVHELAHMMGGGASVDSRGDQSSYEYFSADRASQYYGELHWTAAWPVLLEKVGGSP